MEKRKERTGRKETVPVEKIGTWLKSTTQGRKIVQEIVATEVEKRTKAEEQARCKACKLARTLPVLIVMDSTGAIEVYSNGRINLHIGHTLDTEDWELAEAYLKSTLPQWAYEIFWPINLEKRDVPEKRTITQERRRILDLAILKGFKELADEHDQKNP
jgi:hypothetical protein